MRQQFDALFTSDEDHAAAATHAIEDQATTLLDTTAPWVARIGGLRTNAASTKHVEQDEATELDEGDPTDLGARPGAEGAAAARQRPRRLLRDRSPARLVDLLRLGLGSARHAHLERASRPWSTTRCARSPRAKDLSTGAISSLTGGSYISKCDRPYRCSHAPALSCPSPHSFGSGVLCISSLSVMPLVAHNIARLRNVATRSISPENVDGGKGAGGRATQGTGSNAARNLGVGWKVSPSMIIGAGATFPMATIDGPGT